ncbi:hypothetical protein PILCRDRAFT_279653 [Piloderma croceum F 1598]|uniref:Piwi domain-containing protein n=1 Tax=Piloderma croceum (strain F 1598) TaxID=765440 RepID=A0A0C3BM13_PILCF|nr:hypothetical protein PILCRDRAFT_279653 [Piloderma croceum F 1598]
MGSSGHLFLLTATVLIASRPGHYSVLLDENFSALPGVYVCGHPILTMFSNLSFPSLQELPFVLCHCYASATRSVFLPAHTYYADKVCSRIKFHVKNLQESDQASFISDDEPFDLSVWQDRFNSALVHSMYFL